MAPASGAFISLSDGSVRWRQVAVGIKTAGDGTFRSWCTTAWITSRTRRIGMSWSGNRSEHLGPFEVQVSRRR